MKTLIYSFALILFFNLNAHAWRIGPIKGDDPVIPPPRIEVPHIPTPGEVIDSVQNALPVSPKSVDCEKTRDDAGKHQERLRIRLDNTNKDIKKNNERRPKLNIEREQLYKLQTSLAQKEQLFAVFQNVGDGLFVNENNLKSAIWSIQTRGSDQEFQELLKEFAQSKDPKIRQLAIFMQHVTRQNTKDLQSLLENENMKNSLLKVAELISAVQVSNTEDQALNNKFITNVEEEITALDQEKANLEVTAQQLTSEYNQQEERKACKP